MVHFSIPVKHKTLAKASIRATSGVLDNFPDSYYLEAVLSGMNVFLTSLVYLCAKGLYIPF